MRVEILVGRCLTEAREGFAFDDAAKLEGAADEVEVDGQHLKPALGRGADQPVCLEAGDHLADRTERHAGQLDQFALRDELARLDVARQQLLGEAGIGVVAQTGIRLGHVRRR